MMRYEAHVDSNPLEGLLYVTEHAGSLLFGSELKCLLAAGGQAFTPGTRNYTFDAGFVPATPVPPTPTTPSVLPGTVKPPTGPPGTIPTLPATGPHTRGPLLLAASFLLLGASLVLLARPKHASPGGQR